MAVPLEQTLWYRVCVLLARFREEALAVEPRTADEREQHARAFRSWVRKQAPAVHADVRLVERRGGSLYLDVVRLVHHEHVSQRRARLQEGAQCQRACCRIAMTLPSRRAALDTEQTTK